MTRTNLRIHCVHCHVWDMVVITEESNLPHPQCPDCDMFLPWTALNRCHPETSLCAWGVERKGRQLMEEESQAGAVTEFWAYDRPLKIVLSFNYLGRLLTETDDNWQAAIANIWKTRKS